MVATFLKYSFYLRSYLSSFCLQHFFILVIYLYGGIDDEVNDVRNNNKRYFPALNANEFISFPSITLKCYIIQTVSSFIFHSVIFSL